MISTSDSHEVVFGTYDPKSEVERTVRNLPHWFQLGVAIFLTFRTKDSIPRRVLERRQLELEQWLNRRGMDASIAADDTRIDTLPPPIQNEVCRYRNRLWNRSLDECHGACLLRQPELAGIVGDALLYFNGDRYDLDSFVVMPNHVHLITQFRPPTTTSTQRAS